MAIDWGRMARGVATGYLGAKIANTEANDKLNANIIERAGLNFYENTLPEWQKTEKMREKEFKQVASMWGEDFANAVAEEGWITGDGNAFNNISSILKTKNINKDYFKDKKFSTFAERKALRTEEIQNREKTIMGLTSGSSKIGNMTAELLLKDDKVMTDVGTGTVGTTTETQPSNVEGAPIVPIQQDISKSVSTDMPESIFTKKAEARGVETKFNAISKAVNELGGYGNSIRLADGTTEFRIADEMRTTSNAHIALAEYFAQNRPDINQIDAATLGLQELNNQTVTPFKILASNLNTKYKQGDAGTPATLALGGETIDASTTMIGDQSIRQFIENVYNAQLLDDGYGNVNASVFAKFLENIPENFVINKGTENEEKLKDVIANAHALANYYKTF